jgi:hypothetical protein
MPEKTIIWTCKQHGETEFALENFGTPKERRKCKKCRTNAVHRRRLKLKQLALEYKGGKCQKCGYDKCSAALDFHHRESSDKEFGLSKKGLTRSWEKTKIELDKCDLLCSNCHRELHFEEDSNVKNVEIKTHLKQCEICHNDFECSVRVDKKYCNKICAQKAHNIKRRKIK